MTGSASRSSVEPSAVGTEQDAEDGSSINPTDAVDVAWRLLQDLVAIPSVNGDTGPIADAVVEWAQTQGLQAGLTPTGAPWVSTVADPFSAAGASHTLFFGHLDTVPGQIPVRTDKPDDEVDDASDGPVLWGRGAVDAKGCMAAFLVTVSRRKDDASDDRVWTVIGAVDEEGDSETAHWAVEAFAEPPARVVIGEPSGSGALTLGYKGRLLLRVVSRCPLAHGGAPVPSPSDALLDFVGQLPDMWRSAGFAVAGGGMVEGLFEQITVKVIGLSSEDDGLVGRAEALLDVRVPPAVEPAALIEACRDVLEGGNVRSSVDGLGLIVEASIGGHVVDRTDPFVREGVAALRSALPDVRPRLLRKTGTSDLCILAPQWSSSSFVTYGPGDARLDHGPEERIARGEVARAVSVLEAWFRPHDG